jgi:hypothetical protein
MPQGFNNSSAIFQMIMDDVSKKFLAQLHFQGLRQGGHNEIKKWPYGLNQAVLNRIYSFKRLI